MGSGDRLYIYFRDFVILRNFLTLCSVQSVAQTELLLLAIVEKAQRSDLVGIVYVVYTICGTKLTIHSFVDVVVVALRKANMEFELLLHFFPSLLSFQILLQVLLFL